MREASHVHLRPGGGKLTHKHEHSESEQHSHDGALPYTPPSDGAKGKPFAELDADVRNALDDSDFAYIDSDGQRHLPIHDKRHVRAALSRFGQTHFESPSAKSKAAGKIRAKAKSLGIDISDDALKMAEPESMRLLFGERVDLGERLVPFACTGQWVFTDFGKVRITQRDLDEAERHFRDGVRGQDLPVVNEDHDRSRAIGWISGLERSSPDRLMARVDFNAVGDELLATDQYRYTSPELAFDYQDAATGQTYSLVGKGLALTNYPRLKALGPIAQDHGVGAGVLTCREPLPTRQMSEYGMAPENDPDDDGDDDGPTPPCIYQPPYVPMGCCPGYTRRKGDDDGDGVCALSEPCNGYIAVGNDVVLPSIAIQGYSEPQTQTQRGTTMDGTQATGGASPPEATPAAPAPSGQNAGDFAEMRNLVAAADRAKADAEERAKKAEAQAKEFSEKLSGMERATKLAGVEARIEGLSKSNRITPAEADVFKQEAHLLHFSENPSLLDVLEQRPTTAVDFGERGTSQSPLTDTEMERALAGAVKEFAEAERQAGRKVDPGEAARRAYEKVRGGRK